MKIHAEIWPRLLMNLSEVLPVALLFCLLEPILVFGQTNVENIIQ